MDTDYKVALLGDSGVGKSSLAHAFQSDQMTEIESTIGAAFFRWGINTTKGKMTLQLWDTAGQERFRSLVPIYLRGCHAILLVYDVSNERTIRDIERMWLTAIYVEVSDRGDAMPLIYLVANKTDLVTPDKARQKSQDVLDRIKEKYMTTQDSYLTTIHDKKSIQNLFSRVAQDVMEKCPRPVNDSIHLEAPPSPPSNWCCLLGFI